MTHRLLKRAILVSILSLLLEALPADCGSVTNPPLPPSTDVRGFGALCDGKTDDTAAFRAALASGRSIIIPPLTCVVSAITVPSGVTVQGSGKSSSVILQKENSSGPVVILESTSQNIEVANFTIDGNAQNQRDVNPGLAIVNHGKAPESRRFAGNHFTLRDLFVTSTTGDCLSLDSPNGVDEVHGVSGFRCGGRGIYIQIADSTFSDLDFGATGLEGLLCDAGCANNRFVAVKTWFTGSAQHSSEDHGTGVYLKGVRNQFSALETQNTGGDGIVIYLGQGNILGSVRTESPGSGVAKRESVGIRLRNANLNYVTAYIGNGNCGRSKCQSMLYGVEFDTDGARATSHGNIISAVVEDAVLAEIKVSDVYATKYNSIVTASLGTDSGTPRQWGTIVSARQR